MGRGSSKMFGYAVFIVDALILLHWAISIFVVFRQKKKFLNRLPVFRIVLEMPDVPSENAQRTLIVLAEKMQHEKWTTLT